MNTTAQLIATPDLTQRGALADLRDTDVLSVIWSLCAALAPYLAVVAALTVLAFLLSTTPERTTRPTPPPPRSEP